MRFLNIKITDAEVILDQLLKQNDGSTLSLELKNPAKPMPSFNAALQAFTSYAVALVGSAEWAEEQSTKVTSVHLSEEPKTNRRGLIVTFTRRIERAKNRVAVYNTPLMHAPTGDEEGTNPGTFPKVVADMIAAVEEEATKYWNGEREQVELEFPAGANPDGQAADGGDDLAKARGKKKKDPKAGTPGEVWNPDSKTPPTDEQLRRLCLAAGRDMPIDAIAKLTSTERAKVQKWATMSVDPSVKAKNRPEEPDSLKRFATPALLEDTANAGDGWTEPTPPPKAADVKPVATT